MTIKEHKKNLKKIKIAWIGDGNNVCNSLILGCSKLKIKLSVAVPDGYEPDFDVVRIGKDAEILQVTNNPEDAVKDADVVMTDTFVSIHKTNSDRIKNVQELDAILSESFKKKTTEQWLKILEEAGVPAGPVASMTEMLDLPQTLARDMVVEVEHSRLGPVKTLGFPVKFSKNPAAVNRGAPILGENTREI